MRACVCARASALALRVCVLVLVRCAARVLECARELVLTQPRACAVAVARSPGDNLHNSTDSRYYGPVPRAMLKGVVFARAWPPSAAGWVESKQVHGHLVVDDGQGGGGPGGAGGSGAPDAARAGEATTA